MTAIKAFDYLSEVDELGGAILNAVERVMRSGWLILGPEVERFEHALAEYLGGVNPRAEIHVLPKKLMPDPIRTCLVPALHTLRCPNPTSNSSAGPSTS